MTKFAIFEPLLILQSEVDQLSQFFKQVQLRIIVKTSRTRRLTF